MPINADVVGHRTEPVETRWSSEDCILYALGVGAGALDPVGFELEFTTENSQGVVQKVLPTFPVVVRWGIEVLGAVGPFNPALLVHGEQSVELHGAVPVEGSVSSLTELTGVYDKGSGALVTTRTEATDPTTGARRWTTTSSMFLRGEGGFGGDRGPSSEVEVPDREPEHTVTYSTRRDQALLYRLSGDRNPLHSDPKFAALAGFARPILHGLCTYGFTGRALLHALCGSDPQRFLAMSGRFSRPVLPGEELTVSAWELGDGKAVFRTSTPAGVVLDSGQLSYRE